MTEEPIKLASSVLAALISSGLLAYCFRWVRKLAEARNRRNLVLRLENIKAGGEVMDELVEVPNATRVMLFNGHDSGYRPDLGRPFFVTMIDKRVSPDYEDDDNDEDYNNFQVDGLYVEMLIELLVRGVYDMRVSSAKHGLLHEIYTLHHIKHSRLYYLGSLPDRLVYFSVASHVREFNNTEIMKLDILADKFRSVYRNRY